MSKLNDLIDAVCFLTNQPRNVVLRVQTEPGKTLELDDPSSVPSPNLPVDEASENSRGGGDV